MEGMSGMGSMSGMSGMGSMSGMSGMGSMSGMSGMDGMGSMSGMDGMGSMSGMDGMGSMSGMDGMGSMSGMGGMGGMGGMHMGDMCSMSMVGNWNTIGTCILSPSWHIKTHAQFAGSCIGIFLIVMLIEMVRRLGREWDRYVVRKAILAAMPNAANNNTHEAQRTDSLDSAEQGYKHNPQDQTVDAALYGYPSHAGKGSAAARFWSRSPHRFHPTLFQQVIRSLIYGVQFTGAYLVMLMAMTFNGYIIMCICLGGLAGHFISTWDALAFDLTSDDDPYLVANGGGVGNSGAAIQAEHRLAAKSKELDGAAGRATDACFGHGACC